jgi:hypothetical protein
MAQRLSMLWLNYDVEDPKEAEIGARWKRFRKGSVQAYLDEMTQSLLQMNKLLKPGGRLAVVMNSWPPNIARSGVAAALTTFVSETLRMKHLASVTRQLGDRRDGPFRRTRHEDILIYRKRP